MKFSYLKCCVPVLLIASNLVFGGTFKWEDDSGGTHYGSNPPPGAKNVTDVSTGECATEECRAAETAEAAAKDKQTKELQKQQQEIDKTRAQQEPETKSSSKVPVVVPPAVVNRARRANTGNIRNPNINQPKYKVERQESNSRLTDPENRDPSHTRRNPPGVSIEIR